MRWSRRHRVGCVRGGRGAEIEPSELIEHDGALTRGAGRGEDRGHWRRRRGLQKRALNI